MRKTFLILILSFAGSVFAGAAERIYVSTDKSVYVAGDWLWCSLFNFDTSTRKLSDMSAVAYVELISSDGSGAQAKIALAEGRGSGRIRIPETLPTGNYKVIAYTAGEEVQALYGAKTVSVFNTFSTARVNGGVDIVSEGEYKAIGPVTTQENLIVSITGAVRCGRSFTVNVNNPGKTAAGISLSVYRQDDIIEPENRSLPLFMDQIRQERPVSRVSGASKEYEGLVINAKIIGPKTGISSLSSAGSPSDVYVGRVDDDGKLQFFTNNIYGDRELICETGSPDSYIVLEEPFTHPSPGEVEKLRLCPSLRSSLVNRKASLSQSVVEDTLLTFLPRRQDHLLDGVNCTVYHLDDYVRFHSLEEIFVEIVHELVLRKSHGKETIMMGVKDPASGRYNLQDNIIVMLDGIVLTDIAPLKKMDALLLDDVYLYADSFALGGVSYNGAVNFVSKQNYVKAVQFPANVRVLDFKGCCYPLAYTGGFSGGNEDLRQLLYWHPSIDLSAGGTLRLPLSAPSLPGRYIVRAEGLDSEGNPVRAEFHFDIQ